MRPATYNFNYKNFDDFLKKDLTDKHERNDEYQTMIEKSKKRELGFVAQDVDKVVRDNNYTFNGVYTPQNSSDNYALDYSRFVVPLVKGEQELSKANDSLKAENISLQLQIDELKNIVQQLAVKNNISFPANNAFLSLASLEQNTPNPFKGSTIIGYTLPTQYCQRKLLSEIIQDIV